ncbi:hypothetical protein Vretifemale_2207, partial [Volvox reticuliferus]
ARRRAASVRKVRDWDDSGGAHNWTADPDGCRAGSGSGSSHDDCGGFGGHSDGEERRRARGAEQLNDGSSAASSSRRPSPRSQPASSNSGGKQVANPRLNTGAGGGGCGPAAAATAAGDVEDAGCQVKSAGRLGTGSGGGAAAAEDSLGLQICDSSVLATCSRGSGTDASVPYRSCGTGTATLTSSSSPGTSQSAEVSELRSDTDSEKLRQKSQEEKQQRAKEKQSRKGDAWDGGDLVAEVLAAGKAEQAAAVAGARAVAHVVFAAEVAERGPKRELPLALRTSSPPCASPPPPPLPPTILAIRAPDPQTLLAIQRQVDALRLQHLQRQAQALLTT